MPERHSIVGYLVSPPVPVQPAESGRSAFRLVTDAPIGERHVLVIAGPAHKQLAATARVGDLLHVEADAISAIPGPHAHLTAVRARHVTCIDAVAWSGLSDGGFSAVVRWQSDQDPAWELETRHAGFPSGDLAALYAAGVGSCAAERLVFSTSGALHLLRTDASRETVSEDSIRVWRREKRRASPDDDGFRRVDLAPSELAPALRRQPTFTRLHFYLLSPRNEVLDASIAAGADGPPLVCLTAVDQLRRAWSSANDFSCRVLLA